MELVNSGGCVAFARLAQMNAELPTTAQKIYVWQSGGASPSRFLSAVADR